MLSLNKYIKVYWQLLVGILFFFTTTHSQSNLITNSSFERVDTPVYWNSGEFINSSHFPATRNVSDWDWYNSPDYYSANVPYTGIFRGVPENEVGISYAKHGVAYGGIIAFTKANETKEYIIQKLVLPLLAGEQYCLSFFASRADRTPNAIHSLGAYFSAAPPPTTNIYIDVIPQIVNQSGFITDTVGWTEIQGCYTASGGEQYVTLGNFNSNANTDTLFVGSTNPHPGALGYAYYYIDSVTLWQDNFPTGINNLENESRFSVYPNPANDLINFQFSNTDEKRKLELYDAIGELVLSKTASKGHLSLATGNLGNGIYYYRILSDGKIIAYNKIVIIK